LEEEEVKASIQRRLALQVFIPGGLQLILGTLDLGDQLLSQLGNAKSQGLILKDATDMVDLTDLVDTQLGDEEPAMRLVRHQALALKDLEGLTDGHATDAEPAGDNILTDGGPWLELPVENRSPEL